MEAINRIIDAILLLVCGAFSWAPPAVGLTFIAAAACVLALLIDRHLSYDSGEARWAAHAEVILAVWGSVCAVVCP